MPLTKENMSFRSILTATLLIASFTGFSQTVSIQGKVTDAKTGETIPGVKIMVEGQGKGAYTDFDGNYKVLDLSNGTYILTFKYDTYKVDTIRGIKVNNTEPTIVDVLLKSEFLELGPMQVSHTVVKESTSGLLQLQRNSLVAIDGISSETIKRSPDRSASDALKRVSGASIQDNKFAIIRGLNDRYNAAYLNGAPLPSSESDRKAFAFDIFPVNMLDNLTIVKTASPDLPGEFAGGIIQIKTKDIPTKTFHSFSLGGGYNTITTFKDQLTYQGGKTDWLGVDDGTRNIPSSIPSQADYPMLIGDQAALAKTFGYDWSLQNKSFMPNMSLQYSGGFAKKVKLGDFGLIGSLSYNRTNNYNETERRSYTDNQAGGSGASQIENDLFDKVYSSQTLMGSMLNMSLKFNDKNKVSFKNLYSINADDRTILRTGEINPLESNPNLLRSNARWFTGNNIYSGQLIGEHSSANDRLKLEWVGAYSNIVRTIPNLRRSIYTRLKYVNDPTDPNPYDTIYTANIAGSNVGPDYGGGMFFSQNRENIASFNANLNWKLDTIANMATEIKFGGLFQYRNRDFQARQLGYTTYGIPGGAVQFNQQLLYLPEDSIFQQQNMGLISPGVGGFKLTDGTKPSDAYNANSRIIAGYVAVDNKFGKMVRLNWGARVEHFTQNLTAKRSDQSDLVIATKKLDVLPSFNLIISPTKKQNIRLSGSQTLNRPEYRELAPFAFYDFNTQFVLAGNDSLKRARITNIDLRYEWFPGKSQILSGTFFYKFFENPIEQIARPDVSNEISYKNVPTAVNYGFELDMRAAIGSLFKADSASFWNNLTIYSNLGIIRSVVDVSQNIGTPYQTRPLQGQSPYLFNGGIVYQDEKLNMTYTLNINRVGPRIYILGSIIQPDIWEKSRTFLDFQVAKMFLDDKLELKLNVQNIFAQNLIFYQNNYGNEPTTKGFKRMTNALFLSDPDNKNGYDKNLDDMIWNTRFGRTISFALTYKF